MQNFDMVIRSVRLQSCNQDSEKLLQFDTGKVDFSKMGGLVPTIIQDTNGIVLSLVYSNKESLQKSIIAKKVFRYSREKGEVVMKGATSGNIQELLEIKTDCDNDALLFKVNQKSSSSLAGNACHLGQYSCFGEENEFNLQVLYEKILERKQKASSESYTAKLFADEVLLKQKLMEEATEVILAKTSKELEWECADLVYFLLVLMAKEQVTLTQVIKNLEIKNKAKEKGQKVGGGVIV